MPGFNSRCHTSHRAKSLHKTRRALSRAHVPPTKVFRRLTASLNETIVKPRVDAAVGRKTILKPRVYVRFSRRKILHTMAYTTAEKAIRFRHPDYNLDQAQKLISLSMSRHLSTCNISSKSMQAFLSNLANRQTNVGKRIYLLLCRRQKSRLHTWTLEWGNARRYKQSFSVPINTKNSLATVTSQKLFSNQDTHNDHRLLNANNKIAHLWAEWRFACDKLLWSASFTVTLTRTSAAAIFSCGLL